MKVLHVIDRLEVGGAERVFLNLLKLLSGEGVTVGAMIFNSGYALDKELEQLDTSRHILNRINKFNLATLHKTHKICSLYDIVHTHLRHVHAYVRLAQIIFKGRYKLILHDHAGIQVAPTFRLKGLLKPKHYIGVNRQQLVWAQKELHLQRSNCYLLENTIIPAGMVEYNPTTNHAMMVANIRRVKNIEFAISLCNSMSMKLTIYGNIIEQDYYKELIKLIGENKNIKIVHDSPTVQDDYTKYSIALHTSIEETGPLVLLEYLSAGMPFLSYHTGSVADRVSTELPDMFIKDFEEKQWMERVEKIIADKNSVQDKMHDVFLKHFSAEKYTENCLDIYRKINS